jgi:hypothetical protein
VVRELEGEERQGEQQGKEEDAEHEFVVLIGSGETLQPDPHGA